MILAWLLRFDVPFSFSFFFWMFFLRLPVCIREQALRIVYSVFLSFSFRLPAAACLYRTDDNSTKIQRPVCSVREHNVRTDAVVAEAVAGFVSYVSCRSRVCCCYLSVGT